MKEALKALEYFESRGFWIIIEKHPWRAGWKCEIKAPAELFADHHDLWGEYEASDLEDAINGAVCVFGSNYKLWKKDQEFKGAISSMGFPEWVAP